jgi:hypothetical protein
LEQSSRLLQALPAIVFAAAPGLVAGGDKDRLQHAEIGGVQPAWAGAFRFFESGVTFGAVGMRESVSRGGEMTEASGVSGGSMTPPDCASSFELGARRWTG